jgi:hypothetical protein
MTRKAKLFPVFMVMIAFAQPALAQQWSVEAQAGRIRSALDPASAGYESVVLGARYDHMSSQLRISAGVPTSAEQAFWGSLNGAHRFAFRPHGFLTGLDLAANAFLLQGRETRTQQNNGPFQPPQIVTTPAPSGYAAVLQALPLVGIEGVKVQLHVRGGISHYTSDIGDQAHDRTVTLADAQLTFLPAASLMLLPSVRYVAADDGNYTFAGVTAAFGTGVFSVWGSAGSWTNIDSEPASWAAGVNVNVHERVTLTTSARRDPFDPVYGTPAQDAWNLGLVVKLGDIPSRRLPTVVERGNAVIRLPASQTTSAPRVAGDFNEWKPQPMQRSGSAWIYTIKLDPGVYNYAFIDDQGEWFVPAKHPGRKSDGMGGTVAVLVVR